MRGEIKIGETVRTEGAKIVRKGLRRLDLWIPDNHPVFGLPPKTRANWIRQALDLTAALEEHMEAIESRLSRIEGRLADIRLSKKEETGQDGGAGGEGGDKFLKSLAETFNIDI
ncbi:MAG: hypothetical protein C4575_07030 [Desulforudis sp.]|nr:MAG: hypothetical protein C4575_07030 [Desulforudis sp.]